MAAGELQLPPPAPLRTHHTMQADKRISSGLQGVLVGLVGAMLLGLGAAEAPLPYNYPAPSAGSIIEGVSRPLGAAPGYVGPSLLVASTPPTLLNYQPQQYSDYRQLTDADVHKHVYVHVAPDEPEDVQSVLTLPTPKPKKHYKIVFIKTPAVRPAASAYVNLPQPDQEKTLIYVLTNKPSLQQQLLVSTPAPTPPAKPEVFFIRYKTNEAQPQLRYANGQPLTYSNAQAKPLTNSYGVPLGAPINTGTTNNVNYNTV